LRSSLLSPISIFSPLRLRSGNGSSFTTSSSDSSSDKLLFSSSDSSRFVLPVLRFSFVSPVVFRIALPEFPVLRFDLRLSLSTTTSISPSEARLAGRSSSEEGGFSISRFFTGSGSSAAAACGSAYNFERRFSICCSLRLSYSCFLSASSSAFRIFSFCAILSCIR